MMTSHLNRKARRAAERLARKQERKNSALSATAARHDEAAFLSEPKIQEDDAAERLARKQALKAAKVQNDEPLSQCGADEDEAAFLSEPKIQKDEAALLSEPKTQIGEASSAEVFARKQALKATQLTQSAPSRGRHGAVSPLQLIANRQNAQLSSGPVSVAGKAKSSKNALKTALTGRTVLLPEDDADRYEQHLNTYQRIYKPADERECEIVQSLADATWRLDRIPGLEEALYVKGCNQFADQVSDLDPRARLTMLRMHTYLAYEKQFRNLQIQEMRLHRLREKLVAELKQLQNEREQNEREELATAAKLYTAAKHDKKPFDPADFGFDFSIEDVEAFLEGQRARILTEKAMTARGR